MASSVKKAHQLLAELFRTPELLRGTSLKPRHAQRWVYLGHDLEHDQVARIRFGLIRHPRPYAFSSQSHKVAEYYVYDVANQKVIRQRGVNITRAEGRDSD